MTQTETYHELKIQGMKAKHEINLKTFVIDFCSEVRSKRMNKEDAWFMERYITTLLILT